MASDFFGLSLNHKHQSLTEREAFSFSAERIAGLLQRLKDMMEVQDLLMVGTCNRTEFYFSGDKDEVFNLLKLVGFEAGITDASLLGQLFQVVEREEAVQHLFRVSLGLESQVVGDMQIINQVKRAYQQSADLHLAGPFLHRLMHTIFYANKRVVQETSFRDGAASVSYAAVELAETLTAHLERPRVLILGLGEIGKDVAENLKDRVHGEVKVCNRTYEKAVALANLLGFEAAPFDQLDAALEWADIIISSVAAEEPIITRDRLLNLNLLSHTSFIDLSMPRSVSPDVEEISGCLVYNIEDLQSNTNEVLAKRLGEIPKVESIMNESIDEFLEWSKETVVSPTIQKIKAALEGIRLEEVGKAMKGLTKDESELVDRVTKSMMQRIMKLHVLPLKAACKRGNPEDLVEVLNELFNVEQANIPNPHMEQHGEHGRDSAGGHPAHIPR